MSMKKKKWITPLLTILIKGKPAEKVLSKCRNAESAGFSSSDVGICYKAAIEPIWCDVCWQWDPS